MCYDLMCCNDSDWMGWARFHRYANNASSKSNRSVSKDSNDLTDGFKEVMYKVMSG